MTLKYYYRSVWLEMNAGHCPSEIVVSLLLAVIILVIGRYILKERWFFLKSSLIVIISSSILCVISTLLIWLFAMKCPFHFDFVPPPVVAGVFVLCFGLIVGSVFMVIEGHRKKQKNPPKGVKVGVRPGQ